jgi:colanic acid/amylovoran biosynthesis glycosyltransferase
MNPRIGYFVPEFPGQTHIFYWREIQALESMGMEVDIVSTQLPPPQLMSHTWTIAAQQRTFYLAPLTLKRLGAIGRSLFQGGIKSWVACLSTVQQAKGLPQKLRLAAFIPFGAELSHLAKLRNWQHLHVHSCANSANIALFASHISGLPYSLTLHGPLTENYMQKCSSR